MSAIILGDGWIDRMKEALEHKPVMVYSGRLPDNFESCNPILCVLKKRENKRKMIIFSEDHKVTERYKEVYGLKFLITDTQSTVDALPADSSVKVIFFHDDITANEINTVLLKEV